MNTFKLYFSEDNIRRIRLETSPTYEEFVSLLEEIYPNFHCELSIKYKDEDGDLISVDTQLEWEEMMMEVQGTCSVLRLWIQGKSTPYFKDGPSPETVKFYVNEKSKEAVEVASDFMSQLESNVPECLASLFNGGKIIPTHLPEFLKDAVSLKYINDHVVDLDVDIPELFDLLHGRALSLLDSVDVSDLERGRDYLVATIKLVPDHMLALYNLACAESLLGNTQEAISYLERAVENGFKDIDHMVQDSDLANIQNTEAFQNLIAKLSSMYYQVTSEPQVVEPEVVEPEVIQPKVDLSESIRPLQDSYGEQLQLLKEMGFTADNDVMLLLLEQFEGDVNSVMGFLLGNN